MKKLNKLTIHDYSDINNTTIFEKINSRFLFYYIIKKRNFIYNTVLNAYSISLESQLFLLKSKEKFTHLVKKSSFYKTNLIKFITYFNKKGLFIKHLSFVLEIYALIYRIFLNFNPHSILNKDLFAYITEFVYNLRSNRNLLDIKNLLGWVISWNYLLFNVDVQNVQKKYKKKLKTKYIYKVVYVKRQEQYRHTLRRMFLNIYNYESVRYVKKQFFNNKLDLILNYKKSNLYQQKICIYKKMFKG